MYVFIVVADVEHAAMSGPPFRYNKIPKAFTSYLEAKEYLNSKELITDCEISDNIKVMSKELVQVKLY